jgi:O-succinylhomoserine sulfhydrylase
MQRHCYNASACADFLHGKSGMIRVLYPHHPSFKQHALAKKQMLAGGGMVSFEIEGGKEKAFAFMNALKLIDIANNLGDAKSLITHPATTTHSNIAAAERAALGISDGLLRLSVGLESTQDLLDDLARGLKAISA